MRNLNEIIDDNNSYRDELDGNAIVSPRCDPGGIYYNVDFVCEKNELQASLWYLVAGLFALSMMSFVLFLLSINRKYFGTFFDTRTGSQFLCENWRKGTADKERFYVFSKHESYYKSINKELKDWLTANWDKWEDEKPDWFTAKLILKIPGEVLPDKVSEKLGSSRRKRKKSIVALIKFEEDKIEGVEN